MYIFNYYVNVVYWDYYSFGGIAIFILFKTGKLITFVKDEKKYFYLLFSFTFQLFFLLYCFSGNPLYDIQCYAVYFICLGVTLNLRRESMKREQ